MAYRNPWPADSDRKPVLFSRQQDMNETTYLNHFSVPPLGARDQVSAKSRAFVSFLGQDTGIGTWSCTKDPSALNCPHITTARHLLQQLVKRDPLAQDARANEGPEVWKSGTTTAALLCTVSNVILMRYQPRNLAGQFEGRRLSPISQSLLLFGHEFLPTQLTRYQQFHCNTRHPLFPSHQPPPVAA